MNTPYNQEIIDKFIRKDKKERYSYLLSKGRFDDYIVPSLNTMDDLDPSCLQELPKRLESDEIYQLLLSSGAGEVAYSLSANRRIHSKVVPVRQALQECVGWGVASLIYCIGSSVAYYEGDCTGYYILNSTKKQKK